jgi:DNA adenine methylase
MQAVSTLPIPHQPRFPDTRYMGSKKNLLNFIWETVKPLGAHSVLDAFSGSSCVAQMFKTHELKVTTNDHLEYAYHLARATVANSAGKLTEAEVEMLLAHNRYRKRFIERTFRGIYFSDDENKFLDNISANIQQLKSPIKRSLAIAAICRACVKRRPRGIFTYVGLDKYDDGRQDLRMHLRDHFRRAISELHHAVFDNGHICRSYNTDVFTLPKQARSVDLVYMDPPYVTPHSDNDYLRRYHFVEGLCSYWKRPETEVLYHTKTKKLRRYPTPFASKVTIRNAFERLFEQFPKSKLVVSYSSNCYPNKDDLTAILKNHRRAVSVESFAHRYSFGTYNHKVGNSSNLVDEYLFIAD